MNNISLAAVVIIAIIAGCIFTSILDAHDAHLSTTASCVERIAKEQGYKGNPSGEEAWSLFSSECQ